MQITQQITMHLDRRQESQIVDAVQGETARAVTLALYDKDQPWTVPADASILIRYRKPDCTGGIYDSLPDGSRAWDFQENLVTVRIAPQALAMAGVIAMQIAIVAQGEELASFIFRLRVEADPSVGTLASDDYINIGQWLMPRIYQFVTQAEVAAAQAQQAAADARIIASAAVSSRYSPVYSIGTLDPTDGTPMANDTAVITDCLPLVGQQLGVVFSQLVTVRLFFYDRALAFLGADLMRTASFELDIPEGAVFVRVELRYTSGEVVYFPEDPGKQVAIYTPNTSAADADRAEAAAQAALEAVQDCVKSVNGNTPDENGDVTLATDLRTLTLKVASAVRDGASSKVEYDGSAAMEFLVPAGFTRKTGGYIESIEGFAVLEGAFTPNSYKNDPFSFTNALAFGSNDGGRNIVYIADPRKNKQYRFTFLSSSAFGNYQVETAPLFTTQTDTEQETAPSNDWALVQTVTTQEDVSSISVTLSADNAYNEVYLTFRNNLVTDTSGTTGGQASATFFVNNAAAITQEQLFLKAWSSTSALLTRDGSDVNVTWRKYASGTGGKVTTFCGGIFNTQRIEAITVALTDANYIFTAGTILEVYAR